MDNYVITIARGFGSGGKEIGSRLAEQLGISCYENRILTLASQLSGLDEELFQEVNEKIREKKWNSFLKGLPKSKKPNPVSDKFVSDERLFEFQKKIILDLAETESCVIIGKCADWILKDHSNVISLYIEAPRDFCVKRIVEKMSVNEETAHRSIETTDHYRADYYAHYTGGNYWTNPVNYDLTINTQRVGIERSIELIKVFLSMKFPSAIKAKKPKEKE